MAKIEVDEELCKGCGLCIMFCPQDVFEQSETLNKKGVFPPDPVREDECVECRLCELICPDFAVSVTAEQVEKKEGDMNGTGRDKKSIRAQSTV